MFSHLLAILTLSTAFSATDRMLQVRSTPMAKTVIVNDSYTPVGFDSNDNVEVTISGVLPNACHDDPIIDVTTDESNKEIVINAMALHYMPGNTLCPERAVPFVRTIELGVLQAGNYQVMINPDSDEQLFDDLRITMATTPNPDEYRYADVDQVITHPRSDKIVLKGTMESECFGIEKVRILDDGEDTYSIQPITVQKQELCPLKIMPFSYDVKIPDDLDKEKVLLHVRSRGQESFNVIFQ